MRLKRLWFGCALLLILAFALGACNLTSEGAAVATPTSSSSGQPVVTIVSPSDGSEVVVDTQVLISASASDTVGITRVQLFADGQIVKTVPSESTGGDLNLNVLLDYTPTQTGSVALQVIAYRGSIPSQPAEIFLTVRQTATQIVATTQPPSNPNPIPIPPIDPYDPTCRILSNTSLNMRTGPGTNYDRILILNPGTVAPITGRTPDNSWWQIRISVTTGWVSGLYVTLYGNCSGVIIPPIPPTPTTVIIPTWTPIPPTNTLTKTPQPATATATPGLPDLLISSITGSNTLNLGPGNTPVSSTFAVTITNTGQSATTQFNNTISVSPPGTVMPLGVVAGLGPGESILLTINLTFDTAGSYTLQGRTDSDSQITEASEVNNVGFFSVTVNNAP